jgi:hypothetical protein
MTSVEDSAFVLLDIIALLPENEWDKTKLGLGPLGPTSERLVELSRLTRQELNNALTWLVQRNAIEVIQRQRSNEEFYYRRVQGITADGSLLYQQMKEQRGHEPGS